jgi:hypothetical protein
VSRAGTAGGAVYRAAARPGGCEPPTAAVAPGLRPAGPAERPPRARWFGVGPGPVETSSAGVGTVFRGVHRRCRTGRTAPRPRCGSAVAGTGCRAVHESHSAVRGMTRTFRFPGWILEPAGVPPRRPRAWRGPSVRFARCDSPGPGPRSDEVGRSLHGRSAPGLGREQRDQRETTQTTQTTPTTRTPGRPPRPASRLRGRGGPGAVARPGRRTSTAPPRSHASPLPHTASPPHRPGGRHLTRTRFPEEFR